MIGKPDSFRPHFFFILFLFHFISISQAVGATLSCSNENLSFPLQIEAADGEKLSLVDLAFDTGPYVHPELACKRFLSEMGRLPSVDYRELLPRLKSGLVAHLSGLSADRAYSACQKFSYCRVVFPYNLLQLSSTPLGRTPAFSRGGEVCQQVPQVGKSGKGFAQGVSSLPRTAKLKGWWSPLVRLGDEAVSLIEQVEDDIVILSSMTASTNEVRRIKELSAKKKNVRVILVLDALNMVDDSVSELLKLANDKFTLLPVPRSRTSPSNYHIKGAVAYNAKRFVFSSANLRNHDGPDLLMDLGFSGQSAEISGALGKSLLEQVDSACQDDAFLECMLDVAFDPGSLESHLFRRNFNQSCQFARSSRALAKLRTQKVDRFFVTPLEQDLVSLTVKMIGSAKKSIAIAADQISHPKVIEALRTRAKEIQNIRIVVGRLEPSSPLLLAPLIKSLVMVPDQMPMLPHAKALIIDRKTLLFGTGNFTLTGLSNERELFGTTANPSLVRFYERYVETVQHVSQVCATPEKTVRSIASGIPRLLWAEPSVSLAGKRNAISFRGDLFSVPGNMSSSVLFEAHPSVCSKLENPAS